MQKRCGKFMADWRDEHGRRHRKAFTTKKAAARYQARMQNASRTKKARPSPRRAGSPPLSKREQAPALQAVAWAADYLLR